MNQTILDSLKGSLLEEVLAITDDKLKVPLTNEVVRKKETVIGQLTAFEKACWTLYQEKRKRHDVLHEEMENDVRTDEHHLIHFQYNTLKNLFWASIRSRIPDAAKADTSGFRAGDKIVATEGESEMFRGRSGAFIVIESSGPFGIFDRIFR